ncbi:hypothetical protein, partial [Nonomuraea lactucae]|uniref:hypothetical protein n=1 Tax=Nonomuraea lactucae TaxID=2249762 RepID=UPI001965CDA0
MAERGRPARLRERLRGTPAVEARIAGLSRDDRAVHAAELLGGDGVGAWIEPATPGCRRVRSRSAWWRGTWWRSSAIPASCR